MSILYRALLAAKKEVPNNVVFTVQEWEFFRQSNFITNDRLVGALPFMTVRIGTETRLTDAQGQAGFNLAPGTYTYEVFDMVRFLTTFKGTVTVAAVPVGVDVKIYAAAYTPTQVQNMIANHNYIPVSSDTELDGLRHATPRRMGQGTIHDTVGNVVTGIDKRYIQVGNINLINFQSGSGWLPLAINPVFFSGQYDGNGLAIYNLRSNRANASLFGFIENTTIRNIKISGEIIAIGNESGLLAAFSWGTNLLIERVDSCGTHIGAARSGGLIGCNYQFFSPTPITGGAVKDCSFIGTFTGGSNSSGGLIGLNQGVSAIVDNCHTVYTQTVGGTNVGGLIGSTVDSIVINCTATVDMLCSDVNIGGLIGHASNTIITNCSTSGELRNNSSSLTILFLGGLVGRTELNCMISNSHSSVNITNIGLLSVGMCGGLVGNHNGGSITRCSASGNINNIINNVGGLVGQALAVLVQNCHASGNVGMVTSTVSIGGLIGRLVTSPASVVNCYSTGLVLGTGSVGGLIGSMGGGATTTNSYYDRNTSGRSDTGRGLPRTTQQMQVGTRNSFINPDGTIDITNNPANAMYTNWDDAVWNFDDTAKYPILR